MEEADDDIGYLDAGVVDVVLHVDLLAGSAEEADKGVAENGVAEMTDVRCLVGIDAGVLDQNMSTFRWTAAFCACDGLHTGGTVKAGVNITRARNIKRRKATERAEGGDDLLSDDFGGSAELAGELERDGGSQLAELQLGRDLYREVLDFEAISLFQYAAQTRAEPLL